MSNPESQGTVPIGPALRLLRKQKGLTQTQVGDLPDGVHHRSLTHWERGRTTPSLQSVIAFLGALELDFHDLQDALDVTTGRSASTTARIDILHQRMVGIERRLSVVERRQVEQMATQLAEQEC